MTQQGVLIRNDDGHVLISADVPAFHYMRDATLVSSTGSLTSFGAGDTDTLSGLVSHVYTVTLPVGVEPLLFIKPGNSQRYGVLTKTRAAPVGDSSTWTIQVIQHGKTSQPPERIMVFTELPAQTPPTEPFGLVTRGGDGRLFFDSGGYPLVINQTIYAKPPEVPCDGGVPTTTTTLTNKEGAKKQKNNKPRHNFRCDNTEEGFNLVPGVHAADLAFTAPSLTQAVYDHRHELGWFTWWTVIITTTVTAHRYDTQHFVMYQGGFRIDPADNKLKAGWVTYAKGLTSVEREKSVTFIGPFEIPGNWDFSQTKSISPYSSKTINHYDNAVLLIDASKYPKR